MDVHLLQAAQVDALFKKYTEDDWKELKEYASTLPPPTAEDVKQLSRYQFEKVLNTSLFLLPPVVEDGIKAISLKMTQSTLDFSAIHDRVCGFGSRYESPGEYMQDVARVFKSSLDIGSDVNAEYFEWKHAFLSILDGVNGERQVIDLGLVDGGFIIGDDEEVLEEGSVVPGDLVDIVFREVEKLAGKFKARPFEFDIYYENEGKTGEKQVLDDNYLKSGKADAVENESSTAIQVDTPTASVPTAIESPDTLIVTYHRKKFKTNTDGFIYIGSETPAFKQWKSKVPCPFASIFHGYILLHSLIPWTPESDGDFWSRVQSAVYSIPETEASDSVLQRLSAEFSRNPYRVVVLRLKKVADQKHRDAFDEFKQLLSTQSVCATIIQVACGFGSTQGTSGIVLLKNNCVFVVASMRGIAEFLPFFGNKPQLRAI